MVRCHGLLLMQTDLRVLRLSCIERNTITVFLLAGPHYLRPDLIPNFQQKWNVVVPITFFIAVGIPAFAVWWQQSKLKTA